MTKRVPALLLSLTLIFGISASGAMATDDEYDYGVLVDAPGVDLTYAYCAPCHSEILVAQQGMTRPHWDDLLDWMVEEQGMYEIEEPDKGIVLDYLEAHYNTDRPNFPVPGQ